jgi:hypothetical protein
MTTDPGSAGSTTALPVQGGEGPQVVYVREPKSWGRRLLVLVGTIGLLVAIFFGLQSFNLLPSLSNPLKTQTTDRTGPVLLTSMKDLKQYVAAEGNFQVLVDLQENNSFIPDFILNERTLFVGIGSVEAYVDFEKLTDGSITMSEDRKSVEIVLPEPVLKDPTIDINKSYVFAEERGVVNRVGEIFGNDNDKVMTLQRLAKAKILDAAGQTELIERAKKNTESMLVSLLTQLGFERITVTFQKPPAS